MRSPVLVLQPLDALIQLLEAIEQMCNGVEEPVEEEGCGDEEGVALGLHDGFLVAEVVGGGTGLRRFAGGSGLVLLVDVH
ncbi:hypothetical protein U1Q18_016234 [Sarracenia purpurea var. burkii]